MQWTGDVTKYDGSDPEGEKYETALACGWNNLSNELVLSCVQVPYSNYEFNKTEDITHNILSGLFNDLSIADSNKRLIWVNSVGATGMRYFDTCPDFRSGGGKLHLSAWDGHEIDTMTLSNDMSVVLSSRADSNVQADLVNLSGVAYIKMGVYYI